MAITATVNRPYPTRVQLHLGTLTGPLLNPRFGEFDPRRDIRIYNGGRLMTVDSFTFDPAGNRYLIFLTKGLNFDVVTQVVHHVPNPPLEVEGNPELFLMQGGTNPDIVAPGV
jgi:hypothetical protein